MRKTLYSHVDHWDFYPDVIVTLVDDIQFEFDPSRNEKKKNNISTYIVNRYSHSKVHHIQELHSNPRRSIDFVRLSTINSCLHTHKIYKLLNINEEFVQLKYDPMIYLKNFKQQHKQEREEEECERNFFSFSFNKRQHQQRRKYE